MATLYLKRLLLGLLLAIPAAVFAQAPGNGMFVAFNSDGNHGFAFVTFVDVPNTTTVRFNDNEWNGLAIGSGGAFNAGESGISWTNNTGGTIFAGTVITITNLNTTPAASIGVMSGGTMTLENDNEVIYMFIGTNASTPTTFITAMANDSYSVANGSLNNTGLTPSTVVSIIGDQDIMVYTGSINCTGTVTTCATAISNAANWTSQNTAGDDSIGTAPNFPSSVPCNFYGAAFGTVTYYSRNATFGGQWDSNTAWTTSSDGTGGPLATGVWPRRHDNVVIRSGHTITVNATNDNRSCGVSPDALAQVNIGPFVSSNLAMFYHTGDITVSGTLNVTGIEMMTAGYTHVLSGGTFSLGSNLVQVGYLEVDLGSIFSSLDDLVLTGNSVTIINTNSTSTDDLVIDHTNATLCGTGTATLQNGSGSQVTYTNSGTVNQICTSFTINCTGGGCSGFPVVGTTLVLSGNSGPAGLGNSTNNRLWLMANQQVYVNAGTTLATNNQLVQQWNDFSGNSRHATELTNKPTLLTNIVNGLPAIRFDNTDQLLSTGLTTANSASVYVVAQYSSLPSPNPGLIQGSPSGLGFSSAGTDKVIGMWVSNTNLPWGRVVEADNNSVNIPQLSTLSASTFFVLSNVISAANLNVSQYINNVVSGSVAYDGTLRSWADFGIGRQGTETWFGDISEVVVYNANLNTAQRAIISNYLSAKYATPLSVADDVYTMDNPGNGNFDFEVAGIGQAADGSRHIDAQGTGQVRMRNPSGLANNEFLMWGHNNLAMAGGNTSVDGVVIRERLQRIWRVSEVGDVGNVSISVDLAGTMGSALGSNLRLLIDRDGDGFSDNDVTPISGSFSGNVVTFSGVNFQNGDRFTIGNTNIALPLPIELVSFNAEVIQNEVMLKWTTSSELNNDYFTIQRSKTGEEWETIIDKIKGAGTTTETRHYQTLDGIPHPGVSYYRLKQTDEDGQFSYSSVKRVDVVPVYQLKAFPNPTKDKFTITTDFELDKSNVKLINLLGQEVPFVLRAESVFYEVTP